MPDNQNFIMFIAELVASNLRSSFFGPSHPSSAEGQKENEETQQIKNTFYSIKTRAEELKKSLRGSESGSLSISKDECEALLWAFASLEEQAVERICLNRFLQRIGVLQAKLWRGDGLASALTELGLNGRKNGWSCELLRKLYEGLKDDLLNTTKIPTITGAEINSPMRESISKITRWNDNSLENTPHYLATKAMKEIFNSNSINSMARKLRACKIEGLSDDARKSPRLDRKKRVLRKKSPK